MVYFVWFFSARNVSLLCNDVRTSRDATGLIAGFPHMTLCVTDFKSTDNGLKG